MSRIRWLPWLALVLLLGVLAPVPAALADGKIYAGVGTLEPAMIPDQRAIVVFDGAVQTLAIENRFIGESHVFAWIVPLPSAPTIEPSTTGVFPTLETIMAPRVRRGWSGAALVIPLLAVLAAGLLAGLMVRSRRAAASIMLGTLACLLVLLFVLLPALGMARDSSNGGVRVLDRSIVGVYETVVLEGADGAGVLGWLGDNGFQAPADIEPVLDSYIDRGWVFAAAKLGSAPRAPEPGQASGGRTPHPLVFRFETPEPVYPLRLTMAGNGPLSVDLYVFASGRAASPGFETRMALPTRHVDSDAVRVPRYASFGEPAWVAHPELARLVSDSGFVTHMSAAFDGTEPVEDAVITVGTARAYVPRLVSERYLASMAAALGLGVCVVGFGAIHAARLRRDGSVGSSRSCLIAICGVVLSAAGTVGVLHAAHIVVPEESVRGGRGLAWADAQFRGVGPMLAEEASGMGSPDVEQLRAIVREWMGQGADPAPPVEQDSPGNYMLRERDDGGLEFVWFDRIGRAHATTLGSGRED